MSRIEQVMRELSDLRDFYLKVQRRHETTFEDAFEQSLTEEPAAYNSDAECRLPKADK